MQSRIESGEYASVSDYVRDLIRRDQEARKRQLGIAEIRRTIKRAASTALSRPRRRCLSGSKQSLRQWRVDRWPSRTCQFSGLAEADLNEIALFIAGDSPKAPLRFAGDVRNLCQSLAKNPARYLLREEYDDGVRVAVHGKYLIFYAERGEVVVIERILHGSRHLDWVAL